MPLPVSTLAAMAGAELTSSNLEAQREGLAFVAGFVAYKCHHIDATLGSRSPDFSGAAGDTEHPAEQLNCDDQPRPAVCSVTSLDGRCGGVRAELLPADGGKCRSGAASHIASQAVHCRQAASARHPRVQEVGEHPSPPPPSVP